MVSIKGAVLGLAVAGAVLLTGLASAETDLYDDTAGPEVTTPIYLGADVSNHAVYHWLTSTLEFAHGRYAGTEVGARRVAWGER